MFLGPVTNQNIDKNKDEISDEESLTHKIVPVIKQTYSHYRIALFTSITTAFLLLISLAWNDVVQSIIKQYYPRDDDSIKGKIQYAVIITIIVILLQLYIFPYFKPSDTD